MASNILGPLISPLLSGNVVAIHPKKRALSTTDKIPNVVIGGEETSNVTLQTKGQSRVIVDEHGINVVNGARILINGLPIDEGWSGGGGGGETGSGISTFDPNDIMYFNQLQKVVAHDAGEGDFFSRSALSITPTGSFMVVGAPYKNDSDGAVYVYTRSLDDTAAWTFHTSFTGTSQEKLGSSVAITPNGQLIAMGAPDSRSVYIAIQDIFQPTITFTRFSLPIFQNQGASGGGYGLSLAVAGPIEGFYYIAVSEPLNNTSGIRIYKGGANTWTLQDTLAPSTATNPPYRGLSIDLSRDATLLAVGSPGCDQVDIFRQSTGVWSHLQTIQGGDTGWLFGHSVSFSTNSIAIGAPFYKNESGLANVYRWNADDDQYGLPETVESSKIAPGNTFGADIQIDHTGEWIVAGASKSTTSAGVFAGSAHVFKRSETAGWVHMGEYAPNDGATNCGFGQQVCITEGGTYIAIGSFSATHSEPEAGAVYWMAAVKTVIQYRFHDNALNLDSGRTGGTLRLGDGFAETVELGASIVPTGSNISMGRSNAPLDTLFTSAIRFGDNGGTEWLSHPIDSLAATGTDSTLQRLIVSELVIGDPRQTSNSFILKPQSNGTIDMKHIGLWTDETSHRTVAPIPNVYVSGSNVGIGTSDPQSALEVAGGDVRILTHSLLLSDVDSLTDGGAISIGTNIASNLILGRPDGVIQLDGSVILSNGIDIVENGTAGYIRTDSNGFAFQPPFGEPFKLTYDDNSKWIQRASNVFLRGDSNLSVGIHTDTPTATLDVVGSINASSYHSNGVPFAHSCLIDTTDASNITSGILPVARGGLGTGSLGPSKLLVTSAMGLAIETPDGLHWDSDNSALYVSSNIFMGDAESFISYDASNRLTHVSHLTLNHSNQYVGINNTNPQYTLDVVGSINASEIRLNDQAIPASFFVDTTNLDSMVSGTLVVSLGGTGRNSLSNGQLLVGNGSNGIREASVYWDDDLKHLGIGTSNPLTKIHVHSNMLISGDGGGILSFGGVEDELGTIEFKSSNATVAASIRGRADGSISFYNGSNDKTIICVQSNGLSFGGPSLISVTDDETLIFSTSNPDQMMQLTQIGRLSNVGMWTIGSDSWALGATTTTGERDETITVDVIQKVVSAPTFAFPSGPSLSTLGTRLDVTEVGSGCNMVYFQPRETNAISLGFDDATGLGHSSNEFLDVFVGGTPVTKFHQSGGVLFGGGDNPTALVHLRHTDLTIPTTFKAESSNTLSAMEILCDDGVRITNRSSTADSNIPTVSWNILRGESNAEALHITANGTQGLRMLQNGKMSIGPAGSISAMLTVAGAIRVMEHSNSNVGRMEWGSDGQGAMEWRSNEFLWKSNGVDAMKIGSNGQILVGTSSALYDLTYPSIQVLGNDFEVGQFRSSRTTDVGYVTVGQNTGLAEAVFIGYGAGRCSMGRRTVSTAISFRNGGPGDIRFHGYGAGTLTTDSTGNITVSSDSRVKTEIKYLEEDGVGLEAIMRLKPAEFELVSDRGHKRLGFIAQDVEKVIPSAVDGKKFDIWWKRDIHGNPVFDANGDLQFDEEAEPRYRSLDTTAILAQTVKAVQDLTREVERLKAKTF